MGSRRPKESLLETTKDLLVIYGNSRPGEEFSLRNIDSDQSPRYPSKLERSPICSLSSLFHWLSIRLPFTSCHSPFPIRFHSCPFTFGTLSSSSKCWKSTEPVALMLQLSVTFCFHSQPLASRRSIRMKAQWNSMKSNENWMKLDEYPVKQRFFQT